jgi:hypothetical protein
MNGGNITMVVTATNEAARPVIVQLPPSGDSGPPVSFSYSIENESGGHSYDMRADAVEVTRFAPFESKQFIFDFHVSDTPRTRYELSAGTFVFKGAYGDMWALNSPTITIRPVRAASALSDSRIRTDCWNSGLVQTLPNVRCS